MRRREKVFLGGISLFLGFLPGAVLAATLAASPSSGSFSVGSFFTVDILLNTGGAAIQGVDIDRLNYNRSLMEVQDANLSQSGVQITTGTLMPINIANSVDSDTGKILFSQIASGGQTYTGSGTLAQIRFKVKAAGMASLTFDFSLGNTSDTNVASFGQDILTSVVNGSYNLTSLAVPPSPTQFPTPSPAPAPASLPSPAPSPAPVPPRSSPAPTLTPVAPPPTVSPRTAPAPPPTPPAAPGARPPVGNEPLGTAEPAPDISPKPTLIEKARQWFQDPMVIALTAVVAFMLIAPSAYKFFGRGAGGRKMEREARIKETMEFIVSKMHKRYGREEIKKILYNSDLDRGEVEEAFRRLRIG